MEKPADAGAALQGSHSFDQGASGGLKRRLLVIPDAIDGCCAVVEGHRPVCSETAVDGDAEDPSVGITEIERTVDDVGLIVSAGEKTCDSKGASSVDRDAAEIQRAVDD